VFKSCSYIRDPRQVAFKTRLVIGQDLTAPPTHTSPNSSPSTQCHMFVSLFSSCQLLIMAEGKQDCRNV